MCRASVDNPLVIWMAQQNQSDGEHSPPDFSYRLISGKYVQQHPLPVSVGADRLAKR